MKTIDAKKIRNVADNAYSLAVDYALLNIEGTTAILSGNVEKGKVFHTGLDAAYNEGMSAAFESIGVALDILLSEVDN